MSDIAAGQWLPYETEDGNLHECRVKKEEKGKRKAPEQKPLTIEDLDLRLRMVESILIGGPAKK